MITGARHGMAQPISAYGLAMVDHVGCWMRQGQSRNATMMATVAVLVLGWSMTRAADGPRQGVSRYRYVPDSKRFVTMIWGDKFSIGKLDESGNFCPDARWNELAISRLQFAGTPQHTVINRPAGPALEYRSGRLIPGRLDEDGYFVPRVGAEVIDFAHYQYDPKGPRIYNLPGSFVKDQ